MTDLAVFCEEIIVSGAVMWISDLVLVFGVVAFVAIAVTGVVWADNRLDRGRRGGKGGGGAAHGGAAPPRVSRRRTLPPDVPGSR